MTTRNFFEIEDHVSPPEVNQAREMSLEAEQAVSRFSERASDNSERLKDLMTQKINRRLTEDEEREFEALHVEHPASQVEFLGPQHMSEIVVGSDGKNRHVVIKELNGCFAGIAFFENDRKERRAVVAHQPPDLAGEEFFTRFQDALVRQSQGAVRVHGVLFASNYRDRKPVEEVRSCIENSAKNASVQMEMLEYGDGTKRGPTGLMLIEIPPMDAGPATFSTIQIRRESGEKR